MVQAGNSSVPDARRDRWRTCTPGPDQYDGKNAQIVIISTVITYSVYKYYIPKTTPGLKGQH